MPFYEFWMDTKDWLLAQVHLKEYQQTHFCYESKSCPKFMQQFHQHFTFNGCNSSSKQVYNLKLYR